MLGSVRPIKTEEQYRDYLSSTQQLLESDPPVGSPEADHLEIITMLLEKYEEENYSILPPDPIEAIRFRMSEKGLKQVDLVPYFGTRSRVSEVLSRKRPLTVPMIRAISSGLGIPAEVLVGDETSESVTNKEALDWSQFPTKEMLSRGWIEKGDNTSEPIESKIKSFLTFDNWSRDSLAFRRSIGGYAYSPSTKYALIAWTSKITQEARKKKNHLPSFSEETLSKEFFSQLIKLSWLDDGPKLAVELLEKNGICVVIEPHLKGTHLDGAAMKDSDGTPIIALTLRHDRLDNFWFTLTHELVHLWKHVDSNETFLDDLDVDHESDQREAEANRLARDFLIPRITWRRSDAYRNPSKDAIERLSRELMISPSIIAGRIRKEKKNYRLFQDMVGTGKVRSLLTSGAENG